MTYKSLFSTVPPPFWPQYTTFLAPGTCRRAIGLGAADARPAMRPRPDTTLGKSILYVNVMYAKNIVYIRRRCSFSGRRGLIRLGSYKICCVAKKFLLRLMGKKIDRGNLVVYLSISPSIIRKLILTRTSRDASHDGLTPQSHPLTHHPSPFPKAYSLIWEQHPIREGDVT